MRLRYKIVLGNVIAIMLGLAAASPILVPNLALTTKVQIEVDVIYAYFGVQDFNRNITGLWRNLSNPQEGNIRFISYFIVLNVTNLSDKLALIGEFEVSAAQEIMVYIGTDKIGSTKINATFETSRPDASKGDVFGIAKQNPIVTDYRDLRASPGWSQYWSSGASRLIGITGMVEVHNFAYVALENGTVYLFGQAMGQAYGGGSFCRGFSLKLVQMQIVGKEYLYNIVLAEDEMLRIDSNGIDVYIETRF